ESAASARCVFSSETSSPSPRYRLNQRTAARSNLPGSTSAYRTTRSSASAKVSWPISRAAISAWNNQRPSIALLNLVLGCPCAVTAPSGGAGRQAQPNLRKDLLGRLG